MSTSCSTSNSPPSDQSIPIRPTPADVIEQLRHLCQNSDGLAHVYEACVRLLAEYFQSPFAILQTQTIAQSVNEEFCRGKIPAETWRHLALGPMLACVSENKAQAPVFREQKNNLQIAAVSAPLRDRGGHALGAVTILIQCEDPNIISAHLTELQSFIAAMQMFQEAATAGSDSHDRASHDSGLMASMIASEYESLYQLAFALTNGFKAKFNCEEVSLGRVHRNKIQVLSISGMDRLYPSSPGTIQIRQAMEECLDAAQIICIQKRPIQDEDVCKSKLALHSSWRTKTGNSNCASIPLQHRGRTVGVLSLRRESHNSFSLDDIEALKETTRPLGTAICMNERANRGIFRHLRDSTRLSLRRIVGAETGKHRMAAAAILAVLAIVLFGRMNFCVSVPCRLASSESQLFAAPFEGEIVESFVEEGDTVVRGQLLFAMDTRGLQLRRDKLLADRSQAKLQLGESLNARNRAHAAQADADLTAIDAELKIVEMQIGQAQVRANRDGTITEGELGQRVGEVVAMGETLIRLVAKGSLNAELIIPEDDIFYVLEEQHGELVTNARPGEKHHFQIRRIDPAAEVIQGENVYVAKVDLEHVDDWHRIGMEGVAHIHVGSRSVWWVLLRKPIRFVRKGLWL